MIQVIAYREEIDPRTDKLIFKQKLIGESENVPSLWENIESILNGVPSEERYNLHYTLADCLPHNIAEGVPLRAFNYQDVIAFDIDGVDLEYRDNYIGLITNVLKVDFKKIGIACSGNGLHFIIATTNRIMKEDLDKLKPYYQAVCGEINQSLFNAGLIGNADPIILSQSKTLRLPNTINRKEGKKDTHSYIIQGNIEPLDFKLTSLVNLEELKEESNYHVDKEAVLSGCNFLKYARENADSLREPEWFAMVGTLAFIPEIGQQLCHSYSEPYKGYSKTQTDEYYKRAIDVGKPRVCEGINNVWGKCKDCRYWGKVKTPLQIKGSDYIATEHTGFHQVIKKNGIPIKHLPIYSDLVKFYQRKHRYIVEKESGILYQYTGKHWIDIGKLELENFATTHFSPTATNSMRAEFIGLLKSSNIVDNGFFEISQKGYINFNNGVLKLSNRELLEHSDKYGFKYVLPYNYDPSAKCPRFIRFLEEVTLNDKSLGHVLVEFMAYAISGIASKWGQKALVLLGDGSNGKSVFLDLLQKLVGSDCMASVSMESLSNPVSRFGLVGKLFNVCSETPKKAIVEGSAFKAIVSGESLEVKKLYHQPSSMNINCKLVFACNSMPDNYDSSNAIFRRLLLVPFDNVFTEETADLNIYNDLYAELSGIYNLIIDAYDRLMKQGKFTNSEAMKKKIEEYREEDPMYLFFKDNLIYSEGAKVTNEELFMRYTTWCMGIGARPVSLTLLKRCLKTYVRTGSVRVMRIDGDAVRGLVNYKLKGDKIHESLY